MITQSVFIGEEEFIEVSNDSITNIISYANSPKRQKILICTHFGCALVDNQSQRYQRFEKENSPFWNIKSKVDENYGAQLGALLDARSELALVPETNSLKFSTTFVYIYDCKLKSILYRTDFFLRIEQLHLTHDSLIVSNKKRLIIYNYLNDFGVKDQKYFLQMYKNPHENKRLRYLETHCESADTNQFCYCGKFVITAQKPFKLVYLSISYINKMKNKSLIMYDQKTDKESHFDTIADEQPFCFSISPNGKYLAYSCNFGREIKVYNLQENCLYCVLWLGRSVRRIIACGFLDCTSLGGHEWLTTIREKESSSASMHIFRLVKNTPTQQLESQYKRYFSLLERTFKDYQISKELIGPDFYMKNGILYSYSLCGVVYDIIDFKRKGNHDKKKVENFVKWTDELH